MMKRRREGGGARDGKGEQGVETGEGRAWG